MSKKNYTIAILIMVSYIAAASGLSQERSRNEPQTVVIEDFAAQHLDSPPREIRVTILDDPTVEVFEREFKRRWP